MSVMVKGYQLVEDESLLDALCRGYDLLAAFAFLIFSPLSGFCMLIAIVIVKMKES